MKVVEPSTCLTFEAGLAAVQAAVRTGLEMERPINAAVVDTGGHLLAFLRAPGAPLHSISIAEDKAFTSASFGLATSKWGAVVAGDDMLRDGLMVRDRLVMFFQVLHLRADRMQPLDRIFEAHRQLREHRRNAVVQLTALVLAPH